jgi:Protein of unknown function (DUF429)
MLLGVDFTSRPTRRKPITVAQGRLEPNGQLTLLHLHAFTTQNEFEQFLASAQAWVAGFDLPFALPRELLLTLGWPHQTWHEHIQHLQTLSRAQLVVAFKQFCAVRAVGNKFAHRACDRPAGSSPSMKWVNPPVAFMLHEGTPLLLRLEATLPGMHQGNPARIALEAYPGFLARLVVGRRSYKSDDPKKQTHERTDARKQLIAVLEKGGVKLHENSAEYAQLVLTIEQRFALENDASGDQLDAVLCLVQAAWGVARGPSYGLPETLDSLEGWIVSVPLLYINK